MNSWSMKSSLRLSTCHPLLQEVANKVLELHDCSVFEGYRNEETQKSPHQKSKKASPVVNTPLRNIPTTIKG